MSISSTVIDVAVVGMGFGHDFVPLYQSHPNVGRVAIVEPNPQRRNEVGDKFGVADRFADLESLLADDGWDAVHILSPVRFHADQVVAVLESGRHCACAVPMATEIDDLRRIIAAAQAADRRYMMMETGVFAREFFYARDLLERGELGDLTFFRGAHLQDLDRFAEYWQGYPPMKYLTHALSPALALAKTRVKEVRAIGSGPVRPNSFGNPFGIETGIFTFERDDVVAEITVAFFSAARSFYEGFSVYGTKGSMEWPQLEHQAPLTFRFVDSPESREVTVEHREPPHRPDLLPSELAQFVDFTHYQPPGDLPTVALGSHHGGSHPHLVHEFVSSIADQRTPLIDEFTAADWTAPGICAHESAMRGGEAVIVPTFT